MAKLLMGCLLAIFFIAAGCGGARPYSLMYKSASSELSAPAQARDHRLKANLRAALIGEQGLAGLTLSPDRQRQFCASPAAWRACDRSTYIFHSHSRNLLPTRARYRI